LLRASVLVVDDEELIRWSLQKELTAQGYAAASAGTCAEALRLFATDPADVVLLDIRLPDGSGIDLITRLREVREDVAIIMATSVTALDSAVDAMRRGAWDYVTKPFDFAKLWNSVAKAAERVALRQENRTLRARAAAGAPEVVAESPAMRRVLAMVSSVMATDSTVLLRGESGVGKDLIARTIHDGSARHDKLFLDLNCAGLPDALLESELFGHERGAFTDAKTQKRGLFELAAGGTVYLDEIADAPLSIQPKLLKVLEARTFRRVGGIRTLAADVRVIAATNRDLDVAITHKTLREDLYYRLQVFPIEIPPLRQRPEDIVPLARAFLGAFGRALRKPLRGLDAEAEGALLAYGWPGNVRELRNVIERAIILAPADGAITSDLLPAGRADVGEPHGALAEHERQLIRDALHASGGNQSRAAAQLGISRDALRRRMRRHGLST
jgi:two-component system, NtrC family, response regulator AtoC